MTEIPLKIRCLIVDDEKYARDLLAHFLTNVPFIQLAGQCKNVLEAESFMERQRIDLIFLDIQMPYKTGVDFLKEYETESRVVFTTAYPQYALEGFELEALDYLLKPILEKRFMQCIEKIKKAFLIESKAYSYDQIAHQQDQSITIKSGYDVHRIILDDIEYIESVGEYIRYHTSQAKYMVLNSLTSTETKLPDDFIRTHRSFIVPVKKIVGRRAYKLQLSSGKEIPIGKTYRSKIIGLNLLKLP